MNPRAYCGAPVAAMMLDGRVAGFIPVIEPERLSTLAERDLAVVEFAIDGYARLLRHRDLTPAEERALGALERRQGVLARRVPA